MSSELEEFYQEFFQDVLAAADAGGQYAEDAFFELFCAQVVEDGDLETADRAQYLSPKGLRVDGYGGDPLTSEGALSLIISDFNQSPVIKSLTATDLNAIFKRVSNFLAKSLDAEFRNSLEETSPAFGLADMINARWPSVEKVRLLLISNRILSARVDGRDAEEFMGVPVTHSVWDIERLHDFAILGRGREDINIDLEGKFGGPLSALPAHLNSAGYEAYLVVVPGQQLAAIYNHWGARLLEQNVRVFLQARGNVNKGIRNTLENDPEMFFAYNNGVTATAESVETRMTDAGLVITGFKNLQVVNGGQTTASIHAASRKKEIDLSRVFVQMKLSIVEPEKAVDVVPKISEYANSQNRVNAADFFANHPFHVRMQDFSRRLSAPAADGSFRGSKWFYERARGQYPDARAYLTGSKKREFDTTNPKSQVFSKTDLAKFLMVWRGHPDIVSKGAQKNFAAFAGEIGREWSKQSDSFNEDFYRHAIAKAIIFREVERIVTAQPWYEGGYRANVVAYAIAKIAHDTEALGRCVDFDGVWRKQGISTAFREALTTSAEAVHEVIVNPPASMRNVTEWAKQQACWNRVTNLRIEWPAAWLGELLTDKEQRENERAGKKDQRLLNGIQAQTAVVTAGGRAWREIRAWGEEKKILSPKELEILRVCASMPKVIPTEKQCMVAIEALGRLHREGCQLGKEIV